MNEAKGNNLLFPLKISENGMGKLIQSKDWSRTTLGALNNWPLNLLSSVASCQKSHIPVAVWWGNELVKIYNDAFGELLTINHDDALGTKGSAGLKISTNGLEASLEDVLRNGESNELEVKVTSNENNEHDQHLIFYNTPIFSGSGSVGGVYSLVVGRRVTPVVQHQIGEKLEQERRENQQPPQASELGSFEWDIKNSKLYYSDKLARIFGYTDARDIEQNNFVDRIHPDDRQIRWAAHEKAFVSGVLFYEARVVWPDDSIHWVRFNGYVVFDVYGKPNRMYGSALDITDSKLQAAALEQKAKERRKLLEKRNKQLKMSEERYHKMTEEVEDYAIILLDENGTILNWNKGAQKIKGYSEEEIIGKNFSTFYLDEDRAINLPAKLISEAMANGRAMHEGWRKRKDGSKFWGSVVITALHDDKNNIIGFTKVTRDLTERKLADDTMRQQTTELEIKNKQLEQFAYIASHDLQEPLRKIQTFVHVLEKRIDNPESRQKYFDKINSSAKRMAELIQSVLNYSRLSKTNELWTPTDLNEVFENVKSDFELLISEKNADIKSDHLPTIKGIPLQLNQLLGNLLSNALKFSIERPLISISSLIVSGYEAVKSVPQLDRSKNYAMLTFSDNGIGFDQQYAEKIFTIFQRLNRREDYAGTGIGLALCKRIVENHEGAIKARGIPGKGATFVVYLPIE